MNMKQKILIYDIETDSLDTSKAKPALMGFKSSTDEKIHHTTSIKDMVDIINSHDVIVGWNNKDYDDEVMKNWGASFKGKIDVDLMQVLHGKGFGADKGRKTIMNAPNGHKLQDVLHSKKLDDASKVLGGPEKLGDIDYDWFKQDFTSLPEDVQKRALEYQYRDVEMTAHVYEYLENFFSSFRNEGVEIDGEYKKFLTEEQVRKKYYITASVASLVYKILCNLADMDEEYGDGEAIPYGGGFVADPYQEVCQGNIYCLDYSSLYPHVMIMMNLYAPRDEIDNGWAGKGICETNGTYDVARMAPVSKVLQQIYRERVELKKVKNPKEYTLKIIINTVYGLLGNPAFKKVCDFQAAQDCTKVGQQWVKAARKHFMEHGYKVLYTDTDSVYLEDVFNNKQKLLEVKDKHIDFIKRHVPFPQDTFDMDIDDEIRYMAFFKGGDGNLLRKNYLYVTKEGELVIKGLQIKKSNASPLSKRIFDKFIKPEILNNYNHKFTRGEIADMIESELKSDITLASVFYKVNKPESYKLDTQIQAQIAKKFGEGQFNLIKLKAPHAKGAGKFANYVKVEDADDIRIGQIDLSKTWSELSYFIKPEQKTLFEVI